MKNALWIVGLSALFAVVLFVGGAHGIKWHLEEEEFSKHMEEEAKNALTEAAEDLSFLPPDGVTIKKGKEVEGMCYMDRDAACSAAMKLVPKEPCASKIQLVDSLPLSCDCSGYSGCDEKYPWSCEVKWAFMCDVNAECAKHSDCPGKGWLCRERRCVQYE
ncbi:hypothetical protein GF391_04175 [Candidatus Uhrbacteria bacterium]|nr:hypothetical protein [Candidatus Uhrbacteria bacterium]